MHDLDTGFALIELMLDVVKHHAREHQQAFFATTLPAASSTNGLGSWPVY